MAAKKVREPRVSDVVGAVNRIAPPHLAEEWDNVGLQFGNPNHVAGKILVALEITREVVAEAKELKCRTIVTHHPLIFRPVKSMAETNTVTSLGAELIRSGIAHIAAHTNFDSVAWGTNGVLADLLDIQIAGREFLIPTPFTSDKLNYVVYIPATHVDAVIKAVARAGAGVIGKYSHCTFRSPGTGTYIPMEGANPFEGEVGKLEQADEVRLECVCSKAKLQALLREVRAVHPYEQIAYDLFELATPPDDSASTYGMGLCGELKKPLTLGALAKKMKSRMKLASVGIVGDPDKNIARAAVLTGAGGSAVRGWRGQWGDVLVTGEMTHHDCAEAHDRGIAALLLGHWNSEAIAGPRMADLLGQQLAEAGLETPIVVSTKERNPLTRK